MHNEFLLHHIFLKSVENFFDKIALIVDDRHVTYQQLYLDVSAFICYLSSKGVSNLDRVALKDRNGYCLVVAYWSVILLGATVTIIADDIDKGSLEKIIDNLDPHFFIGFNLESSEESCLLNKIDDDALFSVSKATFVGLLQRFRVDNYKYSGHQAVSSDLAMIIYTSGSTGQPKGVALSHDNMRHAIDAIQDYLKVTKDDVIYSLLPMHFDYGLYQMLLAFNVGATLILGSGILSQNMLAYQITKYNVSILPILPHFISIIKQSKSLDNSGFDLIRMITNTGERLSSSHVDLLQKLFFNADIFSMYGLTECKRCSYIPPDKLHEKTNSIGLPMRNLSMWVEKENGVVCAADEVGQIVISSPTLMQAYWRNELETNLRIKKNTLGRRCLYTGDLGYQDADGFFYLVGRNDEVYKFNGEKISLTYYQDKLERIASVVRVRLFFHVFNKVDLRLFVALEVLTDSSVDFQTVRNIFLRNHQPAFIYLTNSFPLLSNGKLDFKKLKSRVIDNFQENHIGQMSV